MSLTHKLFIFLFIVIAVVHSKSPKGKLVNVFLTSRQLFASLTIPDKLQRGFNLKLPEPRISKCESNYDCYSIEAIAADDLRDKTYFLVYNNPQNQQDGLQVHLYSVFVNHRSSNITLESERIILKELAANHTTPSYFIEGLTVNSETGNLFVHVFPSKIFELDPKTGNHRYLFNTRAVQPNPYQSLFKQSEKKWNFVDLQKNFLVVGLNGTTQSNTKLIEGMDTCGRKYNYYEDKLTNLVYISCSRIATHWLRQLVVKPRIEESYYVDLLKRMEVRDLRFCEYLFAEDNILYLAWQEGDLIGYDIQTGKVVYKNRTPLKLEGEFIIYLEK